MSVAARGQPDQTSFHRQASRHPKRWPLYGSSLQVYWHVPQSHDPYKMRTMCSLASAWTLAIMSFAARGQPDQTCFHRQALRHLKRRPLYGSCLQVHLHIAQLQDPYKKRTICSLASAKNRGPNVLLRNLTYMASVACHSRHAAIAWPSWQNASLYIDFLHDTDDQSAWRYTLSGLDGNRHVRLTKLYKCLSSSSARRDMCSQVILSMQTPYNRDNLDATSWKQGIVVAPRQRNSLTQSSSTGPSDNQNSGVSIIVECMNDTPSGSTRLYIWEAYPV